MPRMILRLLLFPAALLFALPADAQELRGHGGPVRALAVAPDGRFALSGGFDQSAILWRLDQSAAAAVLRFHEGAVNAAAALPDGRFATGGEDGRVALWPADGLATGAAPERVLAGHTGPVAALAVSPDGRRLASAAWDETARVVDLADGAARLLEGHRGPVNGVAFLPDGAVVTAGYDQTLRIWSESPVPRVVALDAPLNRVLSAPDGEIVAAGTDGRLRFLSPGGDLLGDLEIAPTPLVALALSPDGETLAAGGLRGQTPLVERRARKVRATLVGPGLPVWALAFAPDGRTLLSGGADRIVRRWNAATGEHVGAAVPRPGENALSGLEGERGAEVFRACAACHTLTQADGNRAGPTLHGLFGRRIGTAAGYNYSPALRAMEIVWTKETVARLFEIGPMAYTPGTKMPEQTIPSAADRQALVDWLERAMR